MSNRALAVVVRSGNASLAPMTNCTSSVRQASIRCLSGRWPRGGRGRWLPGLGRRSSISGLRERASPDPDPSRDDRGECGSASL